MRNSSLKVSMASCLLVLFISACCTRNIEPDIVSSPMLNYTVSDTAGTQLIQFVVPYFNFNSNAKIKSRCSCSSSLFATGPFSVRWQVFYSASTPNNANWGSLILTATSARPSINGCEQDSTTLTIEFLDSGYYLVDCELDYLNEVGENEEANNGSTGGWSHKTNVFIAADQLNGTLSNNRQFKKIEVKLTNPTPRFDALGNQIHCIITN